MMHVKLVSLCLVLRSLSHCCYGCLLPTFLIFQVSLSSKLGVRYDYVDINVCCSYHRSHSHFLFPSNRLLFSFSIKSLMAKKERERIRGDLCA